MANSAARSLHRADGRDALRKLCTSLVWAHSGTHSGYFIPAPIEYWNELD